MRAIKPARLIVLSVLLALAALGANGFAPRNPVAVAKPPLNSVFRNIGSWQCTQTLAMDEKIVKALDLDDFLYQAYQRDNGELSLYVGYYHSAKKVGAAHDPLVCFQGQGWTIGQRDSGTYRLAKHPEFAIPYSSMVADLQGTKQVIVYWFQVNGKATANTHAQKFAMLLDKIAGKGGDNAFVRLSAPVGAGAPEAARERIFRFVDDFYPDFVRYVEQMEVKDRP
jgi:EpsI family protein